jgi:hypothetical protein
MINNFQYSHRLRHMLNEYNTMFKRLKDIENSYVNLFMQTKTENTTQYSWYR